MNEIIDKELNIEDMIYEIRGKQVMLDSDLAKLYNIETRVLNQTVKRNIKRFPSNFMFQLNNDEFSKIKVMSQIVMSPKGGGRSTCPFAFTEQGVAMLAGLLHTDIAIQTSIDIINAFVKMRHYIKNNLLEQQNINNIVLEDHSHILKMDGELQLLQETFDKLEEKKKSNEIYFNGEFYNAYSRIIDIFNESKEELIIIDNYADKKLLDIIIDLNIKVIVITKVKGKLKNNLIEEYNKQYNNLKVVYNDTFHDRYFIIDRVKVYQCGTSINYIGNKTFSINLLQDESLKDNFIKKIIDII